MVPQSIAVMNGQVGVGKSALVANLAGLAAASGWRVLAVDLDQQGALADLLGYQARSDHGRGLLNAALHGEPLEPLRNVRSGLDVVAGGQQLRWLSDELSRRQTLETMSPSRPYEWLAVALGPFGPSYDLVIADTGAVGGWLHLAVGSAFAFIVAPFSPGANSSQGLTQIAFLYDEIRRTGHNPDIELLAVVLTQLANGASQLERRTRVELAEMLAPEATVLRSTIRYAAPTAVDLAGRRLFGSELGFDLDSSGQAGRPQNSGLLAQPGRRDSGDVEAAAALIGDYEAVITELLALFRQRSAARVKDARQ